MESPLLPPGVWDEPTDEERPAYDRFVRAWYGFPEVPATLTIPPGESFVTKPLPPCGSIAVNTKGATVALSLRCGLVTARIGELLGYCRFPVPSDAPVVQVLARNTGEKPAQVTITCLVPRA